MDAWACGGMVDTLVLGTSAKAWEFESLHAQLLKKTPAGVFFSNFVLSVTRNPLGVRRICGRIEHSEIRIARELSKLEPQGSIAKLSERGANPRQSLHA